jgi:molecular chaperone GrpE
MRGEIAEFVRAEVMTEFLGVYEDLKRARQSMDKANPQQMMIGVGAILEKFEGILKNNGLEQINPQPGDEFNPNEEEAIAYEPSESVADNHIIQTFETGLKVKGRIIKPARVRVSKGKLTEVGNE